MIPVILQPEPEDFDERVRQPGQNWLADNDIAFNTSPPDAAKLPNYWTRTNKELWRVYSGVCAYLAFNFEWVSGATSTDHFVPKSVHAGLAYEWDNYRLSSLGVNRTKNKTTNVLDPIGLEENTFVLNLSSGKIFPNKSLNCQMRIKAMATITLLDLDSPEHRKMRSKHFSQFLRHKDSQTLQELNPFVWYEANRQGLL